MRRSEQEITNRVELEEVLRRGQVLQLAMHDGHRTYLVPLNYGFDGENLYIHSAPEGKKVELLAQNGDVAFAVTLDGGLDADNPDVCSWGYHYRSVTGQGEAEVVSGREKARALELIIAQYAPGREKSLPETALEGVTVFRIKPDTITGKKSD